MNNHTVFRGMRPKAVIPASALRMPAEVGSPHRGRIDCIWLDRGEARDHVGRDDHRSTPRLVALSRSASLGVAANQGSFWLVLRGGAQVECREGRFRLETGAWMALDHDSQPTVTADRRALLLAVLLPATGPSALEQSGFEPLLPGRGRIGLRDRRLAFAHWRRAGVFASSLRATDGDDSSLLRRIAHFLATLQQELTPFLERCPGRALWRRRQVLARMQRVSLYLDGNLHRSVRLSELAEVSHFSTWYFTKTFHALYGQGPREMTARLRLRTAADLLASTDLSIGEVGSQCGFQNACSFARAFRAHHGMTASAYRMSRSTWRQSGQSVHARNRQGI